VPNATTNSSPPASYRVCRGVRGATTADANTAPAILEATRDLLERLVSANGMEAEDIASVWFTTTPDLNAEYPALAARQLGWHDTALMCSHEMAVPHGLKACIRVLIHWNTTRSMREIQHIYIRGAVNLRPDRQLHQAPETAPTASPVKSSR
jgi:chorismate mutase